MTTTLFSNFLSSNANVYDRKKNNVGIIDMLIVNY